MVKKEYPRELWQYLRSYVKFPLVVMVLFMISIVPVAAFTEKCESLVIGVFLILSGMIIVFTATVAWASIFPMFERTELILERLARLESRLEENIALDGMGAEPSDSAEN
jgi:hypothetical protein